MASDLKLLHSLYLVIVFVVFQTLTVSNSDVLPSPDYPEVVPTSPAILSLPEPSKSQLRSHPYVRPPKPGIRAAYWPSYSSLPASAIETSYFTHIYYAFLVPSPTTYALNVTSDDLIRIPEFIHALRSKTPRVKTLLSIGGGGSNSTLFSIIAGSRAERGKFIKSTIDVARKYGFDGVDLDWEFPADDVDMANLAVLYKEWRRGLVSESLTSRKPRLLLTSAVYFAAGFFLDEPRSYPAREMSKYLDWVSPMCFDYHGSWDNFTGLHSALNDPNSNISTVYGIGSWIESGIPPNKIVMGLPVYGRTWKLQDPKVNGVGAPAVGVGPGDEGTLVYYKIIEFNTKNHAVVAFDSNAVSFYSNAGDSWIGYEDVPSIRLKVRFARSLGLGGYFFWALGQDYRWAISREGRYLILTLN